MEVVISHNRTKRAINGSFNICLSKEDAETIVKILNEKLSTEFYYGWIKIEDHQPELTNTPPVEWD